MAAAAAIADASVAAARKRKRRTPAGGAADDCFTCSKRNVKCDRRRPYCSQCLEVGNECSGYKTQLTWNVGVASRGKLRGLSLPIAKAPPVPSGAGTGSGNNAGNIRKSASLSSDQHGLAVSAAAAAADPVGSWSEQDAFAAAASMSASVSPRSHGQSDADLVLQRSHSIPNASYSTYDLSQLPASHPMATSSSMPVSMSVPVTLAQHQHWAAAAAAAAAATTSDTSFSPYSTSLPTDTLPFHPHPQQQQQQQQQQHRQSTELHAQQQAHGLGRSMAEPEQHLSASLDSLNNGVDYMSPMPPAFSREEMVFMPSPAGMIFDNLTGQSSPVPQSPIATMMLEQQSGGPTSCPSLVYAASERDSSLTSSHSDTFDANLGAKLLQECEALETPPDMDTYSTSGHSSGQFWGPFTECEASPQLQPETVTPAWPTTLDGQGVPINSDLLAKMPFFIDYYENTMCPSMVFVDGPSNPFRAHVMQLARGSRSLQHAICALAACNLRMKRKLSLGQQSRDLLDPADDAATLDDHSVSEEYQHRNLAVHLLNEQLNDPNKSCHDSVLATILLLCHYRMAESGIARFHTHFAGVKKILSLRRASPYPPSRDCAWMEAIFTYFDAISASINDRESQLNTSFYGVLPNAQLLPQGAENFVGCDRELFRTVSKLGRLNLLSQNRPVQNLTNVGSGSPGNTGAKTNTITRPGHPSQQSYISTDIYSDGDLLAAAAPQVSPSAREDNRSMFWREWKEARIALQSWEFDPQRVAASLLGSAPLTHAQVRDLGSLSEAFRYAALLYTERLANPTLPVTHSNFRNLVSQVVYYATSLETGSAAEKFLLWPLFVAGSECVNELQQGIVRTKCREIMSRSGYMNNLAALDVLERLWAGDFQDDSASGKMDGTLGRRAPFFWTRCIGGPGVEMEWIMF
ncbi:fungal transcriptional regulatory protein [Niveomyces insectorum RCEF 264]|uniref:Fungal transcriptional regulatory protein n=1 Tax=Niveomyces insectorum RCEF 264 TaxID=1081102 RepID=A0A162MQX8_9HYPO|nr:fungal transcriptional regulatory protein [Niveomyces insectorum RCEF 264]